MIQRLLVGPGWTRYGTETPIEPGWYYKLVGGKPNEQLKRGLGLIAAKDHGQWGGWLAPAEPWVQRLVSGLLIPPWVEAPDVDWDVVGIDPTRLYPWQRASIAECWHSLSHYERYRRGHVWSLGAGKTLLGLALSRLVDTWAVAAPRHVHNTWINESKKWGFAPPMLTTYESVHKLPRDLGLLVADEVHLIKNPETQRHGRFAELAMGIPIVVGFTGSPNAGAGAPDWRWLRGIEPGCVPKGIIQWQHLWGLDTKLVDVPSGKAYVTETWDTPKIVEFVRPYVHTVDASHLLAHLPPIDYRQLVVPKPRDYDTILMGAATTGTRSKRRAQLHQCTDGFIYNDDKVPVRLSTEKISAIVEFVDGLGEPVVIFAAWTESVKLLAEAFATRNPAVIDGSTGDTAMEEQKFQTGLTDVLIANASIAEGMNLQYRCRVGIFMSVSSNPVKRQQAIGRWVRPGQSRGCIVVDVVAEDTQDARRVSLVDAHTDASEEFINSLLEAEL